MIYILEHMGFRTKIFVKLFNNYNIFAYSPPTPSHLHPLQVENCDSNSRLVVDEDNNRKFGLERVKMRRLLIDMIQMWKERRSGANPGVISPV